MTSSRLSLPPSLPPNHPYNRYMNGVNFSPIAVEEEGKGKEKKREEEGKRGEKKGDVGEEEGEKRKGNFLGEYFFCLFFLFILLFFIILLSLNSIPSKTPSKKREKNSSL